MFKKEKTAKVQDANSFWAEQRSKTKRITNPEMSVMSKVNNEITKYKGSGSKF